MTRWLAAAIALSACGETPAAPDPPTDLEQLVNDYEDGVISREDYIGAIAMFEDDGGPGELSGTLSASRLLSARPDPYVIAGDLQIASRAILVVEQGADIRIADGVTVDVQGRLYAVGPDDDPISVFAAGGERYTEIILAGGPNQLVSVRLSRGVRNVTATHPFDTRTLIEGAAFDSWDDVAIAQNGSSGMRVVRSRFGFDTPDAEVRGETVRTRNSGVISIESCEFSYRVGYSDVLDLQDCDPELWPIVIGNRFDGGEDDAVDLDNCSAFVIGNHIRNMTPIDLANPVAGVNGGGVTGDGPGSTPFIANNIIEGCFHAIGFKNGARPVIVNNTIIDSNIGITLYQSAAGNPMPSGTIINNVLADNVGWLDGENNDIVLNGKWWPTYNQVDEVQATADASFNITATSGAPFPGEGNVGDDPLLDRSGEIPRLSPGSPAIDSGLGDLSFPDVPGDIAMTYLSVDFEGNPRQTSGDTLVAPDRGAVESN